MAFFKRCTATGEAGTCLWCGIKLRQTFKTIHGPSETRHHRTCRECYGRALGKRVTAGLTTEGGVCLDCGKTTPTYTVPGPVIGKEPWGKLGAYRDGFFCSLRCAYMFAVEAANRGTRYTAKKGA